MKINVAFDVPKAIELGLDSGVLERVGGVVRFADSKQIVAWLQESRNMSNHAATGSTLLSTLLAAVGTNAGTIETLTSAGSLGLDLVDLVATMHMIDKLERRIIGLQREISALCALIEKQNEKQNYVAINLALDQANVFLRIDSAVDRDKTYHSVIRDLAKAEKTLLADIAHDLDKDRLSEAERLIDCVILLDWIAAYCAAEYGREDRATVRLHMNIASLEPFVRRLVKRLVGKNASLYFHESVSDDILERFIQIRGWLDGDVNIWERVAKEARKGFWSDDSVRCLYREARKFLYTWPKLREDPFYEDAIPRAERAIENFQRLQGYALQIESLDKPYRDYRVISELAAKRLADHDDFVLVIDEDIMERLERLSA